MTALVSMRGVRKSFRGEPVLRGVDLDIEAGETFTILGGSGSGKSVCLKHMIGLLQADAGSIHVDGTDVTRFGEREWSPLRRDFGMLFQGAALFDSLTVGENIEYPIREHRHSGAAERGERIAACLEAVGLPGIADMRPSELSGGMRKRVGLARAIALEPRIVLYDEPTTGLDPANSRRIGQLIAKLQRELKVTSVVVTHDMPLCRTISDRIALLREGRIVAETTPDELDERGHPELQTFLEGTGDPLGPAIGGEA